MRTVPALASACLVLSVGGGFASGASDPDASVARPRYSARHLNHAQHKKFHKSKALIHNASGEVVIDSVDVIDEIALATPVGPPTPPCTGANKAKDECEPSEGPAVVATIHPANDSMNQGQEDDAEAEIPADTLPPDHGLAARLAQSARDFRDLFRPKSARTRVDPGNVDLAGLLSEKLLVPVEGVSPERLEDSFLDSRGRRRKHLAIDIGAPRGTPVLATADGTIAKLSRDRRGGIAIYMRDTTDKYLFYYAHLSRYSSRLRVGQQVKRGEVVGYVGSTGHATGPHLHFAITRLPEDRDLHSGLAVNPYLIFLVGSRLR